MKTTRKKEDFVKDVVLLSVDLGTSFIKTAAYDVQGRCLAQSIEPTRDERPEPGVFIQRGDDLFNAVLNCMRNTVKQLGNRATEVEAIAFTGQMAGFMGVDEQWNDITTWSCSLDGRYAPYADRQKERLAKQFLEISGTNAPQMCSKYEWFKEEFSEESSRIAKYVMISGYIIGRLSGISVEDAPIDGSFIAWTGFADMKHRRWSPEICEAIGIDMRCLPRIVSSNEICGYLLPEMASITGLRSGIPLISGAGDKVSSCVGIGILRQGDMVFEASSYAGLSCMVQDFRPDYQKRFYDIIGGATEGSLYIHKYIQGSGITLDWFVESFVLNDNGDKGAAFREIEEMAAGLRPGSDGLFALGQLGGSAIPFDSAVKGLWIGHTWNHRKQHFYRSLLESFAYDLAVTLERVTQNYPEYPWDEIKIIGGGARSKLWNQILADVTGRRFLCMDRNDASLWGAAILAGNAIGVFDDILSTASRDLKIRQVFEPDPKAHACYAPFIELYKRFIDEFHDSFVRLNGAVKDSSVL